MSSLATAFYLPELIALTGAAGSGKDTVASHLEQEHGYVRLSFADPLRDMLAELLRHVGQAPSWINDRQLKEQRIPVLDRSYRELAQTLGTEWGRSLDAGMWVRIVHAKRQALADRRCVITDLRFPNEWGYARRADAAIWQVLRPGLAAVRSHISETALDGQLADRQLHNTGSIADLQALVDSQLAQPQREAGP